MQYFLLHFLINFITKEADSMDSIASNRENFTDINKYSLFE